MIISNINNMRRNWIEIRSEILSIHSKLRQNIVCLANNPGEHNNTHFIFYFQNDIQFIRNLQSKTLFHNKTLDNVCSNLEEGYKDILLDPSNEQVLNITGNKDLPKYNDFIIRVDSMILNCDNKLFN